MLGENATANEDGRPAPTGNGRPEIAPGAARCRGATGWFAGELAATDDDAQARLRPRAERAEAALADLRGDAARAILGLRRQVEFWQLVAHGVGRTEAAALAGFAESADLADRAVAARAIGSDGFAGKKPIAELADNDIVERLAQQIGIAAFADLAISALAGTGGSADTPSIAGKSGKSGNADAAEGDA